MGYPLGLFIALGAVILSITHLHQSPHLYFDLVAFFVVVGGTLATAMATMPWYQWRDILEGFKGLFVPSPMDKKAVAREGLRLVRHAQEKSLHSFKATCPGLAGEILNDGAELIALGMASKSVEAILSERIRGAYERTTVVANALRSLAKYPPAFGLMGTVLGLVSLMRAVSDGAGSEETGIRMAVALVSTLYGLLLSNLVINPAGESLVKGATAQSQAAELALQAVVLATENVGLLESQEMLNSFLSKGERIPISSGAPEEVSAA